MGQLGSLWLDLLVYEDGRPSSHCLSSFQNCILCLISVAMHYICYTEWAMYTQRVVVEVFVEIRSSYASGKNWQSAVRKKEEDFKGQSTQKCFIFQYVWEGFIFTVSLLGTLSVRVSWFFPDLQTCCDHYMGLPHYRWVGSTYVLENAPEGLGTPRGDWQHLKFLGTWEARKCDGDFGIKSSGLVSLADTGRT